jgi:glycosyltransferase involved in cell wall biosynthesis
MVLVKSNSIIYDPRVGKIVRSLSKKYSTLVLGWNREGVSKKIINDYIVDLKLFNMRAPFDKPFLVAYFPFFWIWILIKLFTCRPKVVHACDLDAVIPCYIYKIIFRKKLVFDVFDRYAMTKIPPKFKTLYSLVDLLEEIFAGKADVLINVSEKLLRTFKRKPKVCPIIMNCPEDFTTDRAKSEKEQKDDGVLTIVHTGGIWKTRGLENIVTAIKDLKDVELIIAGRVMDIELQDQILKLSNAKYEGILMHKEALNLEARADAMVGLYDLKVPINNFSMGNKLFEAMMLGVPIITNVAAELVNEVDCGIMVDYNNINQIKQAVISLRDNIDLRRKLGTNGRKAFIQKYNWTIMEQQLHKIYDNLLNK